MPRILERDAELARLDDRRREVRGSGRGRLVVVSGEAGIGKSSVVRELCARAGGERVVWGGCDALRTPRALGPFADIAEDAGGELLETIVRRAPPAEVAAALVAELRGGGSIVVLEDLHWADEATLDVLRLLARRIASLPALLVATCRAGSAPLEVALGDVPADAVDRIELAPLSLQAVHALAGRLDPAELHHRTAGNPFFVTEVVAAGGDIPRSVRDAVLARAARLDEHARMVLDAVAIEPARMELRLLEALADGETAGLDACLEAGMVQVERTTVGLRHEIARAAIEEALSPLRRLQLHRRALAALQGAIGRSPDLARLAHHAEAADDAEAVLRFAPAAAARAAALGSHREAASQYARALRHAGWLGYSRRVELLERRSYECYLTGAIAEATEARRAAMELHRAAGDRLREGGAHRWLSRLAWCSGENAVAEEEARVAIELLEALGPGRELAMAYSNQAQLRMLTSDDGAAIAWGERAIALAEGLGEPEILAHALNNAGTAELRRGGSAAKLERSLALALEHGFEEHVARAYANLGSTQLGLRDYAAADRSLDAGIAYCRERDLDAWRLHMGGERALSQLARGRWDDAAESACEVLAHPGVAMPSRIYPLVVLGRLRARRGEANVWPPLDEALELARRTGELRRLHPVASARAEARWLGGEDGAIGAETVAALRLAVEQDDPWAAGELLVWRRRAGMADEVALDAVAEPFMLELAGAAAVAAERWAQTGCPYDAALALAHADQEAAQREALGWLQRLGAPPAALRVARMLRERSARDVSRGPRAATRADRNGLTAREQEVLGLVAEGLRNADIAARLFVSEKTVAHHVSAILRKLDVRSRGEAAVAAERLQIADR
jgi:DNA-binding CsgD family transcriptional regulator